MRLHNNFKVAIESVTKEFLSRGKIVNTEQWQGIKAPAPMFEAFEVNFSSMMSSNLDTLKEEIKPNLPWADIHFDERVSGLPLNPGESYKQWPFYGRDDEMRPNEEFSHTYMERYWPKWANDRYMKRGIDDPDDKDIRRGIRYEYADLNNLIDLLAELPYTRQAYLPIFFPEDTGNVHRGRVPCTLGYLFSQREGYFHITYYIRACDYLRHFRDDIYLTARLLIWVLERLSEKSDFWKNVRPGIFTMNIASLHVFGPEVNRIK